MVRAADLWSCVSEQCFCCLWLLLCFLVGVCLLRILPLVIMRLSAESIVFISILFHWCESVGSGVFVSVCSISFV